MLTFHKKVLPLCVFLVERQNTLMTPWKFLLEGLRDIKTVGTIAPTSRFAGRQMIRKINFKQAKCIVEFGAGDGVITHLILARMQPDAKLLCFEVNENFCEILHRIQDPRLIVIQDSAEKLGEYLTQNGFEKADYIVSAIPFTVLPDDLAEKIIQTAKHYLSPNGFFVQIHYSLIMRKVYKRIFGNVDVEVTPINIPPAFILTSHG